MQYTLTQILKAVSDESEAMLTQQRERNPEYDMPKHDLLKSIHCALSNLQYNTVQASNIVFAHTRYNGNNKFTLPLGEALSIMAGNLAILKEQKNAALEKCAAMSKRLESLTQKDFFK